MSDAEWDLIADLVPDYSGNGKIGRPPKHSKRDIVNAIFYVAATGCQWRALPANYPNWNTCHRYHVTWSRDGTWEKIVDRLRALVRADQGHDVDPSVGIIDARSVRGASTVTSPSRGYDAGKKISGRKCFGIVDTPSPAQPTGRGVPPLLAQSRETDRPTNGKSAHGSLTDFYHWATHQPLPESGRRPKHLATAQNDARSAAGRTGFSAPTRPSQSGPVVVSSSP